jgi:hypothetical protein
MHSRLAWRRAAMSRSRCACRQGQSHGATASGAACVRRLPGARRALTGRGAARGRALLLNAAGTLAVSGGADHTLRLWDLGQQRCLQAFAVHTDSVWALAAPPDLGLVFSGGRDRCVYRRAPRARVLAQRAPPPGCPALRGWAGSGARDRSGKKGVTWGFRQSKVSACKCMLQRECLGTLRLPDLHMTLHDAGVFVLQQAGQLTLQCCACRCSPCVQHCKPLLGTHQMSRERPSPPTPARRAAGRSWPRARASCCWRRPRRCAAWRCTSRPARCGSRPPPPPRGAGACRRRRPRSARRRRRARRWWAALAARAGACLWWARCRWCARGSRSTAVRPGCPSRLRPNLPACSLACHAARGLPAVLRMGGQACEQACWVRRACRLTNTLTHVWAGRHTMSSSRQGVSEVCVLCPTTLQFSHYRISLVGDPATRRPQVSLQSQAWAARVDMQGGAGGSGACAGRRSREHFVVQAQNAPTT